MKASGLRRKILFSGTIASNSIEIFMGFYGEILSGFNILSNEIITLRVCEKGFFLINTSPAEILFTRLLEVVK